MPELLASVTSKELSELRAYELVNGDIGSKYSEEILASIHEQLQQVCAILLAQGAEDEDDVPKVVRVPRPNEIYTQVMESDDDG